MIRQITEKELKIACSQLGVKIGLIELIIVKVRENQRKSIVKPIKCNCINNMMCSIELCKNKKQQF